MQHPTQMGKKEYLEKGDGYLMKEYQTVEEYQDFVESTIKAAIARERTCLGLNVLISLAENLGVEL